ncbi:MAG: hypothetical protein JXB18_01160 [Sedimentisphaerales bacterium]|nr:hypothetical protein [Sedimentisphaerales bacterium]
MKTIGQIVVILVVSLLAALLVWPRKKKHPGSGCGPGCMCHAKDHSDCQNPEKKAKSESE